MARAVSVNKALASAVVVRGVLRARALGLRSIVRAVETGMQLGIKVDHGVAVAVDVASRHTARLEERSCRRRGQESGHDSELHGGHYKKHTK